MKVFTLICRKMPEKPKLSKTLSKVDIHKNVASVNAFDQCERTKTEFLKTLQYPTTSFTKPEQCERTKTDVFSSVFV